MKKIVASGLIALIVSSQLLGDGSWVATNLAGDPGYFYRPGVFPHQYFYPWKGYVISDGSLANNGSISVELIVRKNGSEQTVKVDFKGKKVGTVSNVDPGWMQPPYWRGSPNATVFRTADIWLAQAIIPSFGDVVGYIQPANRDKNYFVNEYNSNAPESYSSVGAAARRNRGIVPRASLQKMSLCFGTYGIMVIPDMPQPGKCNTVVVNPP